MISIVWILLGALICCNIELGGVCLTLSPLFKKRKNITNYIQKLKAKEKAVTLATRVIVNKLYMYLDEEGIRNLCLIFRVCANLPSQTNKVITGPRALGIDLNQLVYVNLYSK